VEFLTFAFLVFSSKFPIGHVYHTHGLINARTVDVFVQEPVIAVGFDRLTTSVFGNHVIAVVVCCKEKSIEEFRDSV